MFQCIAATCGKEAGVFVNDAIKLAHMLFWNWVGERLHMLYCKLNEELCSVCGVLAPGLLLLPSLKEGIAAPL